MGMHDKVTHLPLASDTLHLGKSGSRLFAARIKYSVFWSTKRKRRFQEGREVSAGTDYGSRRNSLSGGNQHPRRKLR